MMNDLKPFLYALFQNMGVGQYLEIRLIEERKKGSALLPRFFASVEELLTSFDKLRHQAENGTPYKYGVHLGVCPRCRKSGKKADVKEVHCLWSDIDAKDFAGGKDDARKSIEDFPLQPSAIIDSAHGFHAYFFLNEPEIIKSEEARLQIEGILKGISQILKGDSVFDISRVLRLPCTFNFKDPENPVEAKIIKFEPSCQYNLGDFADFGIATSSSNMESISFPKNLPEVDIDTLKLPDKFKSLIKTGWTKNSKYKSRSEADQAVISCLIKAGCNDATIKAVFSNHSFGISQKYVEKGNNGDDYLANSITNAKAYWNPTLGEVHNTFSHWLYIDPSEQIVIDIALAAVVANRIQGDPIWIFLVAPPGSTKTELLRAFADYKDVYHISTLTENSLISGKQTKKFDPSLLPKLDGKVLVIKDFTTILTMRDESKRAILGQLRDAFDGSSDKAFGSIGTRRYKSRFGLMAAVTPLIDKQHLVDQQLGERFLKFRLTLKERKKATDKAFKNIGKEDAMRKELASIVSRFLISCSTHKVSVSESIQEKIVAMGDFLAKARTSVARHWKDETIEYKPVPELGTRLVKQLAKLGMGLAIVRGKNEIIEDEYQIIRRVGENTIPAKLFDILEILYKFDDFESTQKIGEASNYPTDTARKVLEDFMVLKIVNREGSNKFKWKLTDEIRKIMDIYKNEIPF